MWFKFLVKVIKVDELIIDNITNQSYKLCRVDIRSRSGQFNTVLINSVDFYFVSLALEIYNKHGLNIWKDFHNFYDRIESYNASRKKCYNLLDYPANDGGFLSSEYERRYFEIVSSQATNIYLNMKNQNVGT